jgi:hypothetical protein
MLSTMALGAQAATSSSHASAVKAASASEMAGRRKTFDRSATVALNEGQRSF